MILEKNKNPGNHVFGSWKTLKILRPLKTILSRDFGICCTPFCQDAGLGSEHLDKMVFFWFWRKS